MGFEKITLDELREIFGDEMPVEAALLLEGWDLSKSRDNLIRILILKRLARKNDVNQD